MLGFPLHVLDLIIVLMIIGFIGLAVVAIAKAIPRTIAKEVAREMQTRKDPHA